jgi:transcriptional regulator with XRE-family HTH domain
LTPAGRVWSIGRFLTVDAFAHAVGHVLRRARIARGFTLFDVRTRSRGQFKPSALGAYERGERSISLERFYRLAGIYTAPPDQLLADVRRELQPQAWQRVVLDLNRLSLIHGEERHAVVDLVNGVRAQRGDRDTDVITLRDADLEALAVTTSQKPKDLLVKLAPAMTDPYGASGSAS